MQLQVSSAALLSQFSPNKQRLALWDIPRSTEIDNSEAFNSIRSLCKLQSKDSSCDSFGQSPNESLSAKSRFSNSPLLMALAKCIISPLDVATEKPRHTAAAAVCSLQFGCWQPCSIAFAFCCRNSCCCKPCFPSNNRCCKLPWPLQLFSLPVLVLRPMAHSSFSWERFNSSSSMGRSRHYEQQQRQQQQEHNDLFVFGYSCKLYRDSEKFAVVSSGRNLIPWMGNDELLIDRYDARGYLNDLSQYDTRKPTNSLNTEEIEFEQQLNEERFADLIYDEISKTPEAVSSGEYSKVGYQYDQPEVKSISKDANNAEVESKGNSFKVPPGLTIPSNIILPESDKAHCVIEKTASFVAQQGSQMEILLKTKQASNSNFDFLSIDSSLHPYYKFILGEIKSGRYVSKESNGQIQEESDDESDDDNYLHPSLLSSKRETNNKLNIVHSVFKPKQEDDSYSQLVKHFKDKYADNDSEEEEGSSPPEKVHNAPNNETSIASPKITSLIPQPPSDTEAIIIKLAQHVVKNGTDFENSIKALNDKKFAFINPGHIYHAFYVKQKIHESKKRKPMGPVFKLKETDSTKTITFSIPSKEPTKNITHNAQVEKALQEGIKKAPSSAKNELNLPSKEQQLQMERKKKLFDFINLLRQEKRIDSPLTYGPDMPKPKEDIQLSPTIEEVTSPCHSPVSSNHKSLLSSKKLNMGSLLPFTAKDELIKRRSLSRSPVRRQESSFSPPRRYRIDKDLSSFQGKRSSNHHKRESKRKHGHRSKSRSRSRSRSRSSRRHRKRLGQAKRPSSKESSPRLSRSPRSPSPKSDYRTEKIPHRPRNHSSRSHRHRSRSPSR